MTAYRAVAGDDIRPKMTIITRPGAKPFLVTRVEPACTDCFVYLYSGDELPEGGATYVKQWYAEVVA